jgi:hypothetical protein
MLKSVDTIGTCEHSLVSFEVCILLVSLSWRIMKLPENLSNHLTRSILVSDGIVSFRIIDILIIPRN